MSNKNFYPETIEEKQNFPNNKLNEIENHRRKSEINNQENEERKSEKSDWSKTSFKIKTGGFIKK